MRTAIKHTISITLILLFSLGLSAFAQRPPSEFFYADSIRQIHKDIRSDRYGKISSLIIFQGPRLVHEKYFGFSQRSTLHPISSVTKSVTSIAVGICIDNGFIPSINEPIFAYFPEYQAIFERDTIKKQITLRHLLMQTAGFAWDEWKTHYSYAGNPLIELSHNPNSWIPIVLNLPLDTLPGTKFTYNSACSDLLKEIICRTSGQDFVDFIDEYIFIPLGIDNYHWDTYPGNGNPAWGGLSLTSLDMAKLGLLMVSKGKWRDQQVVSSSWIDQSTAMLIENDNVGYGLHWWVKPVEGEEDVFFAAGYGDQYVFVDKGQSLVIAVNAKNFTDHKWDSDYKHLFSRIIRAYAL